jgi:hypothetical protein
LFFQILSLFTILGLTLISLSHNPFIFSFFFPQFNSCLGRSIYSFSNSLAWHHLVLIVHTNSKVLVSQQLTKGHQPTVAKCVVFTLMRHDVQWLLALHSLGHHLKFEKTYHVLKHVLIFSPTHNKFTWLQVQLISKSLELLCKCTCVFFPTKGICKYFRHFTKGKYKCN